MDDIGDIYAEAAQRRVPVDVVIAQFQQVYDVFSVFAGGVQIVILLEKEDEV